MNKPLPHDTSSSTPPAAPASHVCAWSNSTCSPGKPAHANEARQPRSYAKLMSGFWNSDVDVGRGPSEYAPSLPANSVRSAKSRAGKSRRQKLQHSLLPWAPSENGRKQIGQASGAGTASADARATTPARALCRSAERAEAARGRGRDSTARGHGTVCILKPRPALQDACGSSWVCTLGGAPELCNTALSARVVRMVVVRLTHWPSPRPEP